MADPPGEWQTCVPSGTNRQEVSYAEVGGQLYLGGGTTHKLGMTLQERYDPKTGSWSQVAPLPKALDPHTGRGAGGKDLLRWRNEGWPGPARPDSGTVFVYNPATDSFSEGTPMPAGRHRGAARNVECYGARSTTPAGSRLPDDV